MAKLSLCMIVKNPTKELQSELWRISPYFDEIIIATQDKKWVGVEKKYQDSSSESRKNGYVDEHKEGKQTADALEKTTVYYLEWTNDFAAARNSTFEKATGDYCFWMDADDTLINPENLPKIVEKMEKEHVDWCFLEYLYEKDELGRVIMRQWSPRIMKRGTGSWVGKVHETFIENGAVNKLMVPDVVIDHHTDETHRKASGERNLAILLEEWRKDKEATDPRTLYYLGNTLLALERYAEAIPFYSEHIKKCGWPEEKYFSMYYLSQCLMLIGKYDEAINVALTATKLFPNWSLIYFALGQYYTLKAEEQGDRLDWNRGIEWLEVGLRKNKPDTKAYFTNDLDYSLIPLARLSEAYAQIGDYDKALELAERLQKIYPNDKSVENLVRTSRELVEVEDFVRSFVTVVSTISNKDRIKSAKMFDYLPTDLDEDYRIQHARRVIVPPKAWPDKSIVIYCHQGLEDWGPPSLFTGVGGSEEAVIHMSNQLTQLGYKVTVYNRCGDYRGTYKGVEYVPYYHFNPRDSFDTLIAWRYPEFMDQPLRAKKKYLWLHDIVGPNLFNERIISNVDKVFFLSEWHRNNVPDLPEEKVFITNNGIDPKQFENLDIKKRPNSLVWTSSYDRGLLPFLKNIWPLIKKEIPDVTLDVCYGWDNIKKQMAGFPHLEQLFNELQVELAKPGITHHGRIGHKQVAELLASSMVMPYASEFGETNNISSQKAQSANCYVITTSQAGGTPERIKLGEVIQGDGIYTDAKLQREFADAVIRRLTGKRPLLIYNVNDLRDTFSWETTAKQWHELFTGQPEKKRALKRDLKPLKEKV